MHWSTNWLAWVQFPDRFLVLLFLSLVLMRKLVSERQCRTQKCCRVGDIQSGVLESQKPQQLSRTNRPNHRNPTNRGNKSAKFRNPTNQQNKSAKSAKFGRRFGGWVVSGAAVSRISRPRWHIEFPVRFPGKNRKIGEMGKDRGNWGEIGEKGETTGVDGGGLCWRSEKWGKLGEFEN